MQSYLGKETQCTTQKAAELSKRILRVIVKDMRPLSLVEGEAFIDMIEYACPGFKCPSRWWFTKQLEKAYQHTLEDLKKNLQGRSSKITLTTDAWTSIATEAYLGMTCHYINDNWEMVSFVLCTKPLEDRHTAENIARWIEEVAEKFDFSLRDDVQAIVHDNAANVVKALRILEERHGIASLRCAGHTTQLIVNHALKDPRINKALGAARSLVGFFHSSDVATLKLKLKQEQMGTAQHKLTQDVAVRWNSSYYMITRLLEQRWPVTATLSDPEVTKATKHYLDMKADQWSLLEELQQALVATVFLSGEAYVTVSVLPPLVKGLQKSTQTAFESAAIATFQTTAAAEIASRWKKETTYDEDGDNVCIFAAALDPRFRKLKFLSTDDILKVKIKLQALALEARRVQVREEPEEDDSPSGQQDHFTQKPKSVLDTLLGTDDEEELEDEDPGQDQREDAVRNELLVYFGEKPIPKDKNPLQWWKENETKFPALAVVAKSYLAAPATSTPSERLFSAAGTILSKKRASLTKEHVDMLTFLHSNSE